jgi:hypothetical protein
MRRIIPPSPPLPVGFRLLSEIPDVKHLFTHPHLDGWCFPWPRVTAFKVFFIRVRSKYFSVVSIEDGTRAEPTQPPLLVDNKTNIQHVIIDIPTNVPTIQFPCEDSWFLRTEEPLLLTGFCSINRL